MIITTLSVIGMQCNRCTNRNFCITLNATDRSNSIIHIRVLNAIDLNADDLNAVTIAVFTSLIRIFQRNHKGAEAGGLKGQCAILIADNIQFSTVLSSFWWSTFSASAVSAPISSISAISGSLSRPETVTVAFWPLASCTFSPLISSGVIFRPRRAASPEAHSRRYCRTPSWNYRPCG